MTLTEKAILVVTAAVVSFIFIWTAPYIQSMEWLRGLELIRG